LVGSHVPGADDLPEGLGGQLLVRVEVPEWWHGVVLLPVVLMGCRWSAAAPSGPGAGGAAPRCSRHSSGRRGDRLPARSPGPVREHRDRGREQCRYGGDQGDLDPDSRYWPNFWDCLPCSYAARTGDQRSVIKETDFYSARQLHGIGMYSDYYRPLGLEHSLMVCLPKALPGTAGPGRYVRLHFLRGPGPDFSGLSKTIPFGGGWHATTAPLPACLR